MAEAPEIPEAKDPFERRVALSIAILAVVLAVISMVGDNAKLAGLLASTRAANGWAYYQSKSIKEHTYALQKEALETLADVGDEERRARLIEQYGREVARYKKEKDEIRAQAEAHEKEVEAQGLVNDRCDLAGLQLQIAIVLGSVAILVSWRAFWYASLVLGLTGALTAASAFLR